MGFHETRLKHLSLVCFLLLLCIQASLLRLSGDAGLEKRPKYWIDLLVDLEFGVLKANQSVLLILPNKVVDVRFKVFPNAFKPSGLIEITNVSVNGIPVEKFWFLEKDNTTLSIPLPSGVSYKEEIRVNLSYTVKVPNAEDRFGYYERIMALGNWFPILAVIEDGSWISHPYVSIGESFYSECADFTVKIRVERNQVIAATGSLVEEHKIGNMTIQTWIASNVRDFALALSSNYEVYSVMWENVTVYSYYLPEHKEAGVLAAEIAARSLEIFSRVFGKYPYPEFRVAEVHGWFGGMEYPTIVFISSRLYSKEIIGSSSWNFLQRVITHEVAHQWWYGIVGNDQYDDPWLDEALAEYSSMLYYKFVYGDRGFLKAFDEYVINNYYEYIGEGKDLPIASSMDDFPSLEAYNAIVYSKGAMVLRLLSSLIGEEAFFSGLRLYFDQNKFDVAKPKDLIKAFETSYGQRLDWFFDRWIFGSGIPSYEIANVTSRRLGKQYIVDITIVQKVANGSPFSLPVPLLLFCEDGTNTSLWAWVNDTICVLQLQLPCEPVQVIVDPNDIILGKDQNWIRVEEAMESEKLDTSFMLLAIILVSLIVFFVLVTHWFLKKKLPIKNFIII